MSSVTCTHYLPPVLILSALTLSLISLLLHATPTSRRVRVGAVRPQDDGHSTRPQQGSCFLRLVHYSITLHCSYNTQQKALVLLKP
eukprot:9485345-Pyramimonas_sp.AAC.1